MENTNKPQDNNQNLIRDSFMPSKWHLLGVPEKLHYITDYMVFGMLGILMIVTAFKGDWELILVYFIVAALIFASMIIRKENSPRFLHNLFFKMQAGLGSSVDIYFIGIFFKVAVVYGFIMLLLGRPYN